MTRWPSKPAAFGFNFGIASVTAVLSVALLATGKLGATIEAIVIGVLGAALYELLKLLPTRWPEVKLIWAATRPGRRSQTMRVSVSYLYRLRVDDRYLLIRGQRIPDQFQPVGGVFKRFPEASVELTRLGVHDDNALPIDESSKDDLRVRVPGANLPAFVRWYERCEGREIETFREFHEELVRPGILSAETFAYLMVRHVRRHRTSVRWSKHFQCWELLIAEIVEPQLTDDQAHELAALEPSEHPTIMWASEELIRSQGYDASRRGTVQPISESSFWLL